MVGGTMNIRDVAFLAVGIVIAFVFLIITAGLLNFD